MPFLEISKQTTRHRVCHSTCLCEKSCNNSGSGVCRLHTCACVWAKDGVHTGWTNVTAGMVVLSTNIVCVAYKMGRFWWCIQNMALAEPFRAAANVFYTMVRVVMCHGWGHHANTLLVLHGSVQVVCGLTLCPRPENETACECVA